MHGPHRRRKTELPPTLALTAVLALWPAAASPRALELVEQHLDANLMGASSLAVSPDGRYVYAGGHRTVVFERDGARQLACGR